MILTFGQQARPAGLSTLEQAQAAVQQAQAAASTAAAQAVTEAQPLIEAATQTAADAAVVAAEAQIAAERQAAQDAASAAAQAASTAATDAAAQAAPAAADAVRAQVAADADRSEAVAARIDAFGIGIQPRDRLLMGTGQWAPRWAHDAVADDPALVFVADWTRGGALVLGQGTMEDAISVSRASPGYYLDSAGVLQPFAAGQARVGDRGLLIEPPATNLALRSNDFGHAAWTKARATVTASAVTIAGLPAFKMDATNVAGTHLVQQAFTAVAGESYTFSVFAAPGEDHFLHIQTTGVAFPVQQRLVFDLTSGTVIAGTGTPTGRATQVAGGWRCEMTVTAGAAGNGFSNFLVSEASTYNSYTGLVPARGIYIAGGQVEVGSRATSLIETAGAAATRAADIVALRTGWWPTAEGTIYLKAEASLVAGAYLLGATGTTDSPLLMGAANTDVLARADGTALTSEGATQRWGRGIDAEMVSAWSPAGRALAMRGALPSSDATVPPAAAMAFLGSRGADTPGEMIAGYIKAMRVWNKRLEAA